MSEGWSCLQVDAGDRYEAESDEDMRKEGIQGDMEDPDVQEDAQARTSAE